MKYQQFTFAQMSLPLKEGHFYHIYNRANGNEKLFVVKDNYRFFMEKYQLHISPIADTYCYCLMPNHFHFLVRVKEESFIKEALPGDFPKFKTLESLLSKRFSNFFSSYTQAFNKQQRRMGSLFMKNFKRKRVDDMRYMKNLIEYIHRNPVESNLTRSIEKFEHSSYTQILKNDNTFVKSQEIIDWYFDIDNFKICHSLPNTVNLVHE